MTESPADEPTGLVIVDKPAGWTSHDVVARMRRLLGTRKVGHGGTLDPMATGVLIIACGKATRLLTFISAHDKAYDATIRLGQSTITGTTRRVRSRLRSMPHTSLMSRSQLSSRH